MTILHKPSCKKNSFSFFRSACVFLLTLFITHNSFASVDPEYDEISVFISVPGLGSAEIPAVIYNDISYLAVADVFNFLKIKNSLSPGMDSVSGFFISPEAGFVIDSRNNRIAYMGKVMELDNNAIIRTTTNLYLRSDYFGRVFGLECTFHFRSLTINLTTKLELPAILAMRQEVMRNNMRLLKGEVRVDTNITRSYPLFHFGVADWSVVTTHDTKGISNTRLNLALGAIIAGGEANVWLNYDSYTGFLKKQQYYQWRYVNNDYRGLRQVMAGKIFTGASSSIYAPVVGVQLTNTPTTFRRSFGSYVLSQHAQPNWLVELYVNNVLVDYVRADAAGFFTFDVPLVYGNSVVKLRYYGPWGEERTTEQNINIPFNFLPLGQFEYTVSAGVVEDSLSSHFSRVNANYGLGKSITIGGGVEYLSAVATGKIMPFVNASIRLAPNLLVSGEYIYGVKTKGTLNYRLPFNLQVEGTYTRYKKGQKAINNTYVEERRASLSFPFHSSKVSLFSRLSVYQIILPFSSYTTVEGVFSGVAFGINANITTYAIYSPEANPYIYSNLSSTFRLPAKLCFTPQVQYEYGQHKFIGVKGELTKSLSYHGAINIFYENNFKSRYQSVGIGLRYDFSFAQIGFSARHANKAIITTTSARGSLIYSPETDYVGFNNRSSVGKGGIMILPYLDVNGNGKRDKYEPKVTGLNIRVNAGRIKYNARDTTILISDLEAYSSYIVQLNTNGFDNVSWQIKDRTLQVTTNANELTLIEVPIAVMGEVSGMVMLEGKEGPKGLGRVQVNFYRSDATLAGQAVTETDGYFNFAGLPPGTYTARVNPSQLQTLHLVSVPGSLVFTLAAGREGDIVDGLKFVLQALPGEGQNK